MYLNNTHTQNMLLAFALQRWLRERVTVLRHSYIAWLVILFILTASWICYGSAVCYKHFRIFPLYFCDSL